jgi:NAD(P)-dependent dehydrogenase (short-subunit alcohol dehydrogenase family)
MEGVECAGIVAHVGLSEDRRKLIEFTVDHYSKLDILVSNAAVNPHCGDLMEVSDAQWDKLLSINVSLKFIQKPYYYVFRSNPPFFSPKKLYLIWRNPQTGLSYSCLQLPVILLSMVSEPTAL